MSDDNQSLRLLEALLFASASPLEESQLAQKFPEGTDVAALLRELQDRYANRGVNLLHVGRGWAFRTAPDLKAALSTEVTTTRRLSRAAIETLAIIAYHQPITRAEIETVRGVALSKGTIDLLFEENWIEPKGRRRSPGRPLTWGTTKVFLDHFGLEGVSDLPGLEDLKAAGLLNTVPPALGLQSPGAESEAEEGGGDDAVAEEEESDLGEALDDAALESAAREAGFAEAEALIEDEDEDDPAPGAADGEADDERQASESDGEPAKAAAQSDRP